MSHKLIPQTIRMCTTQDGVRIAHATAGKGLPLVLAPTWFTHLQYNWESAVWRHWNRAFSERHKFVRYDPRGSGLSDRKVTNLSFEGWINDLEAVVDDLKLEQFPLLGFCQGAAIAIAYAARHPERVSRLILYGSFIKGAYVSGDEAAAQLAKSQEDFIRMGWAIDNPAYQELFAKLLMPEGNPEQLRCLCEQQQRSATPEVAAQLFGLFQSCDISELITKISHPALVLHLRNDAMVPFAYGQEMAGALPNARFVPLEGNNHMMLENESAWHNFKDEVEHFLAEEELQKNNSFNVLTEREHAVLDHIARGLSNEEIADSLHLSVKTVRNHITRIFSKLDVQRRSQAIVRAREAGFGR